MRVFKQHSEYELLPIIICLIQIKKFKNACHNSFVNFMNNIVTTRILIFLRRFVNNIHILL